MPQLTRSFIPCVRRVRSLPLTLIMQQVAVPRRRSRELGAAVGAAGLGRVSGLLALVTQQVAKGAELSAVASVFPALRLRPALYHSDVAHLLAPLSARRHHRLVRHVRGSHARTTGGYTVVSCLWSLLASRDGSTNP
jgi:hypothetical protein